MQGHGAGGSLPFAARPFVAAIAAGAVRSLFAGKQVQTRFAQTAPVSRRESECAMEVWGEVAEGD